MTLFELKDGRLGPASPGRPADDGATGWALAAVRHQLTEILGWPVLPISWSRIEGGDALTALDPIGQVIHLEVLRTLDASALLAAMARQAEASALNRTELSALYPGGAGIFRRDWNAFRASAPEGARPGPRLVIVTAFLAAEVRAGAALLAGSGVEIRVLDVRMVGDGNGQERILVGVEPLRTAGASASAGNTGNMGSAGSMGSAGNVGGAPVEAGGRHGTGPVAEPSPRQMPDTTVMAPATPSWSGAPDGPTGTGVLPAMTGSGPWTPDGSTPPGGSPIVPGALGGPGVPGAPGGPGGPVGLSGPGGPGGSGGLGGPGGSGGLGGPGGPGAPVTQLATVPVRRASGLVSPSHVIRMPAGATSPVLSPSSSASVASPSPAAPPPPPPALPSEASPHAAPGDLPTAPYSVASPPREPSMPAFSPSAAPSSIAPPRTTTPSRPLTPPRPMAQVAPPAPMSAPPAMGSSPAPAAPSPIERPETSFAPSVVPPRVPTSSRSATPSRPLTPARPMPPVVEPSAVTSSPSPEGSLPSELSAASFALTMPMTTSSASSAAVPLVSPAPPSASSAAVPSVSPAPPSASSAAASPVSSIPPSVSSAAASILPSAPSALPSALSPAPPTRVGAFSDHGGAPAPTGRQAVSWLDERHESRALVEDLRGPHAVVDNVDSRDSIERRASHRSAAPVLGARPTVAPGAPAARALAVVASRVETPAALVWRSARRGINHEAVLSADGYLTLADGRRFTDPSRAADEAQHTQDTDGWRVWRLGPGGPSLGEILQSESQAPAEPRPQAESRRAQAEPRTRAELRARDQYRDRDRIGA